MTDLDTSIVRVDIKGVWFAMMTWQPFYINNKFVFVWYSLFHFQWLLVRWWRSEGHIVHGGHYVLAVMCVVLCCVLSRTAELMEPWDRLWSKGKGILTTNLLYS